jgi:hypothetical protein
MRNCIVFSLMLLASCSFAWGSGDSLDQVWLQPHNFLSPDYFDARPTAPYVPDDTINVRINSDNSGQIQNEQQLCINPTNADNVVAVWRDFRLGYRRIGVGYSFDGGLTWTDTLFPVTGRPWHSDPGLTHDIFGNFFAVVLAYEPDQSYSGFEVFKSTDGGVNWGPPTVAIDGVPNVFEDKELLACDRAFDSPYRGNLYIAWTRFYRTQIQLIRSTDDNQSWYDPVVVSDQGSVQWAVPVVGAGGIVYVGWVSYTDNIKLDRSYDGGVTWGTDVNVTSVYTASTYLNGDIWVFSFPAMDADISGGPNHGNLYMAYMDKHGQDYDIYFRASTDEGSSWSQAVRLNDDLINNGRDQFHPWLVVDENGVITVLFYDRREDPANLRYHIFMTQSFDAGQTWTDNVRITTVSSDPSTIVGAGLIGEYSGLDVHRGVVNTAWTDFRLGDQDTFGARNETYNPVLVAVSMVPDQIPVTVPAGGSFTFTGILENNTERRIVGDVWIMLNTPIGVQYGPIQRFDNIPLQPRQYIAVPGITQEVPSWAPLGDYEYVAYTGIYPSTKIDSASFDFTITAPAGEGGGQWNLDGWFDSPVEPVPGDYLIVNNYPNPFNASTDIDFILPAAGDVKIEIYNLRGQLVETLIDDQLSAGRHTASWNASDHSSGVYFYRLIAGEKSVTKKMTLLK